MKIRDIVLMLVLIFIDQITKHLAFLKLSMHDSIEIIKDFFYITLVKNEGAAWGVLSGNMILFYVITLVALVLIYRIYKETPEHNKIIRIALTMIASGAIGNFIDRVMFKYVRDFLNFYIFSYDFPVFNIADTVLVIGVGIIIAYIIFNPEDDNYEEI